MTSVVDVTIGLPIPDRMAAAYSYFGAASSLGYDRAEGLRFDFLYGGTPLETAKALASGACLFAPLNMAVGFLANERGWPLRAVYSSSRRAHRWFAVPPDSAVTSLADFRGKRIACDFADLRPLAESALAEEGIDAREVAFVPWRGSGMEVRHMLSPLRGGEVDGVFLIDWNHGDFIAEGMPMRRIPSRLMDSAELSSCLWTMPATLAEPCVAGVCRALAKATLFAIENPASVIEMMWSRHRETRPEAGERARELRRGVEILRARMDTMRPEGAQDPRWGAMLLSEFAAAQNHLRRSGAIQREHDPRTLFDPSHVVQINAFDSTQVIAQARSFPSRP
ncbi:MAG: ABC transporter substrate-binding protein [Alphaproteobacteria bacterium]